MMNGKERVGSHVSTTLVLKSLADHLRSPSDPSTRTVFRLTRYEKVLVLSSLTNASFAAVLDQWNWVMSALWFDSRYEI